MTNPHEVVQQAINGRAKGIAMRLGKSLSYVYKMLSDSTHCRYSRFLQVYFAIDAEHPEGADQLFEDFRARRIAARKTEAVGRVEWLDAVAKANQEGAEAISAAIDGRDPIAIERELCQDIDAKRRLLQMVVARETKGPLKAVAGRR